MDEIELMFQEVMHDVEHYDQRQFQAMEAFNAEQEYKEEV